MSILSNIDDTINAVDTHFIKQKLFKSLYENDDDKIIVCTVWQLVQMHKLTISEIELLLNTGICSAHPVFVKVSDIYFIDKTNPLISDFNFCKAFVKDRDAYFKHYDIPLSYWNQSSSRRTQISQDALSCLILFNPVCQAEYIDYIHKQLKDKDFGFYKYPLEYTLHK